ncbi:MAG: F0F1 ATP synthase subunit epsilon [Proteobacteria bacterium]|nr:F0F1 ATP synthase subunit epsilon [Pseudomonadota bacterium]
MKLKILLPAEILIDQEVRQVVAEAENGSFCLLPHHIDFVAGLVPGILAYETAEGKEEFIGVDEGILVKVGQEVLVSTGKAVRGPELEALWQTIQDEFKVLNEREKKARSAVARLEADLVRRFMEIGGHGRI